MSLVEDLSELHVRGFMGSEPVRDEKSPWALGLALVSTGSIISWSCRETSVIVLASSGPQIVDTSHLVFDEDSRSLVAPFHFAHHGPKDVISCLQNHIGLHIPGDDLLVDSLNTALLNHFLDR